MRPFLRYSILLKLIGLILSGIILFYLMINPARSVLAQGGLCNRNDFAYLDGLTPPGPTPIQVTQPTLPTINQTFNNEANSRNITSWVLKAIAKRETIWRHIDTVYPNFPTSSGCNAGVDGTTTDCTCISNSGAYGIMQIFWPAHNSNPGWDWNKILSDYAHNIQRGTDILLVTSPPMVNQGDLSNTGVSVNWYLKLWAYNGFTFFNNPSNRPRYNDDRNWDENKRLDCSNWPKGDLSEGSYTYQEQVLYRAWCQPNVDDFNLPSIGQFPIPDDTLFANSNVPGQNILIFDTFVTTNCATREAIFQYTLNPLQAVKTQIIIRNNKPWQGGNIVKTLPVSVDQWDGTNSAGQPVSEGLYWYTVAVRNTSNNQLVGSQSGPIRVGCEKIFLPLVLKNEATSGCTYTIDNLLQDSSFNNLPNPIWQEQNVFAGTGTVPGPLDTLRTMARSAPGDSPWAAVLGSVNDTDADNNNKEDHLLFEHAVYQAIVLPNNIDEVALEYSYYLTTQESPQTTIAWDKFFVDLDVEGLSFTESLLGQPIEYSNRHTFKNQWRRRGLSVAEGGDGLLLVKDMKKQAGKALYLVFYSEVDRTNKSTFYIDAVKLKGCTTN